MPQTLIPKALEAWREGERLLEHLPPLSPDHESVALAVASLRVTVQALSDEKSVTQAQLDRSRLTIAQAEVVIAGAKERQDARDDSDAVA